MTPSPTLRSRRLRAILKDLREERGLTLGRATSAVDWTGSKLSRIETGQRGAHPNDVRALADIYGIKGHERTALIQLAREARQRGWWQPYGSAMHPGFDIYVGLESEATTISMYQPEIVPGLLQTEDYARAQMRAAPVPDPEEKNDKRIAVRMKRQERLTEETAPQLLVILNESVLRREVGGPGIMRDQLAQLVEFSQVPTITLQVLPFASGAHPATLGSFHVLSFADNADPDFAYIEYLTGSAYLEEPQEIAQYMLVLNHLRAGALNPDDSRSLLSSAQHDL